MEAPVKVSGKYWTLKENYPNGTTVEVMTGQPILNRQGVVITKTTTLRPGKGKKIEINFTKNGRLFRPHGRVAHVQLQLWPDAPCPEYRVYSNENGTHRDVGPAEITRFKENQIRCGYYVNGKPARGPFGATVVDFWQDDLRLKTLHVLKEESVLNNGGAWETARSPESHEQGFTYGEAKAFAAKPFCPA